MVNSNWNLHDVVTPIKVDVYHKLLQESGFDKEKTRYLVQGFKQGFDIGYQGPQIRRDSASNIPIKVGLEKDMWEKLMKEVELGRHAGPFLDIPYENYIQSPIGHVPKAGNKT